MIIGVEPLRYGLALVALIAYPVAIMFWLLVHPLARRWRRLGPIPAYSVTLGLLAIVGGCLYRARDTLLAVEFGTAWLPIVAAIALYGVSARIERDVRRRLSARTLVGLPELTGEGTGTLLDDGIFSRVRHPRYYGAAYGVLATALFTNYLAIYVIAAAYGPAIYLVTILEERELVERFGEQYRDYQRRVPRLIPRRRGDSRAR